MNEVDWLPIGMIYKPFYCFDAVVWPLVSHGWLNF